MEHVHGNRHEGHRSADFLSKFWITFSLAIPALIYSEIARTYGFAGPLFFGWEFAMFVVGSVAYIYCGRVFLAGALRELRDRLPGMMTLISLAITAAYFYSSYALLLGDKDDLTFELVSLIAIMLLGHWIEMRSVAGAQGALKELSKLLPDVAEVIGSNGVHTVALTELRVGDRVLVRPGSKVPADGTVIEGRSDVNESILTGESKPVQKGSGSSVIAGSINGDGSLTIEIVTIGEQTFLAGVMRLVEEAQASKSRLQILSDRAASYLTLIAIMSGALTFAAWIAVQAPATTALERLVAVLVIACPHALGLAVPLVAAISTTLAAKNGFLIRQRISLEGARNIDTVLFDKTGTLTKGEFGVVSVSSDETLALAAAVEQHSQHPIGRSIVAEAQRRGLLIDSIRDFENIPATGVQAIVGDHTVFVGQRGGDDIVVERGGERVGTISVADVVRPEAKEAIQALQRRGVSVAMITGDSDEVARSVAAELGIKEYFARVRPEEKAEKVRLLQSAGRKVAMVGDGVNDAPALTTSDLGIAVGAGTNVAIESAGIILVRNDPRDIPKIFELSRVTYRKMIQNLWWATGYNIVAIPLAGGVLASRGILLEPWLAAIFMSASTIVVALNALLLRRSVGLA